MAVKKFKILKIEWRKWKKHLTYFTKFRRNEKQTAMNNAITETKNALE